MRAKQPSVWARCPDARPADRPHPAAPSIMPQGSSIRCLRAHTSNGWRALAQQQQQHSGLPGYGVLTADVFSPVDFDQASDNEACLSSASKFANTLVRFLHWTAPHGMNCAGRPNAAGSSWPHRKTVLQNGFRRRHRQTWLPPPVLLHLRCRITLKAAHSRHPSQTAPLRALLAPKRRGQARSHGVLCAPSRLPQSLARPP